METENSESERYNRQSLIDKWDQVKLSSAKVAIVGASQLGNFVGASLAALGVGNIDIYDSERVASQAEGFLFRTEDTGSTRASALEMRLKQVNPRINIHSISELPSEHTPAYNLVLDLTNINASKEASLKYAEKIGSTFLSAACDATSGESIIINPGQDIAQFDSTLFEGAAQGSVPSHVLGGLITEEVRKALMPLTEFEKPVRNLAYSLASAKRFSKERQYSIQSPKLQDKKVLIVGAGALGNFAALGMGLLGVGRMDIMDFDDVELTNLNRQILFYDAVGRKKSEALAEKIAQINPGSNVRGIVAKLDEHSAYFDQNKPDLILDCVDSFASRAYINYFAVRNRIPLVSGGTNPKTGQVIVYRPGIDQCLNCRLDVDDALAISLSGASCKNTPDPSVIMTNEVIGGMMVGEAMKVLAAENGEPVPRVLKYDSTVSVRGGLVGSIGACNCSRPHITDWLSTLKGRYDSAPQSAV